MDKKRPPTVKDLYPTLNEEQLAEAEENLHSYIQFVVRMYERIAADPERYEKFQKDLAEHRKVRQQAENKVRKKSSSKSVRFTSGGSLKSVKQASLFE